MVPGLACRVWCGVVGTGVGLTDLISAFPPVPTVTPWFSHGEAGDTACAR